MLGGKGKGVTLFAVGIALTLITVAILLFLVFGKFGDSASFKSGFGDMESMDPLTKFYVKNRRLKEMYATMLNVDSGTTYDVYKEFVDNPGARTPRHIYEKALEILQEIPTMDLYHQTNDVNRLTSMITFMDAALTDVLSSKFYTSERMDGVDKHDEKLLNEYTSANLDEGFMEYLRESAPYDGEKDIMEDMINATKNQDYDLSRYVEALERDPNTVGQGTLSVNESYEKQGKKLRVFRQYPGSTNPRVIADDNPLLKDHQDVSKDRNIPTPGILGGKTRDIEFASVPWRGRRTDTYMMIG